MRLQKYYCSIIISCICRLNSEDDALVSLLSHYAKETHPVVCCVVSVQTRPPSSNFTQEKLPEFNFRTLTVYMHSICSTHAQFPLNIRTEQFPSADAAEVFPPLQQDVNVLGSTMT